jgi:electron transport complex protein RnfG
MKDKSLKGTFPIVFLTLVALIAVSLLVGIDSITAEKIEQQEEQKVQEMLAEMFADMDSYQADDPVEDIYTVYVDEDVIGYAFEAVGKGYGGDIKLLIGLEDDKSTLKGVTVISQEETPGLGSRITDEAFLNMFTGIDRSDVALSKDGGEIDAITGATISSSAVVDTVVDAISEKAQLLGGSE